jgi:hypothetical protein
MYVGLGATQVMPGVVHEAHVTRDQGVVHTITVDPSALDPNADIQGISARAWQPGIGGDALTNEFRLGAAGVQSFTVPRDFGPLHDIQIVTVANAAKPRTETAVDLEIHDQVSIAGAQVRRAVQELGSRMGPLLHDAASHL